MPGLYRLQPMPRVPVSERILEILNAAEIDERNRLPRSYSAAELASVIYATEHPNPAQTSAVRRALARLYQADRVRQHERSSHTGTGAHYRSGPYGSWVAQNPAPVRYARPMTEAEHAAKDEMVRDARAALGALR